MRRWLVTSGRFGPGAAGACSAGAHGPEAAPWRSGTTSWSAHRSGRRASAWIGDEKKQQGRDDADCANPAEGDGTSQREGDRTQRRAGRETQILKTAVE